MNNATHIARPVEVHAVQIERVDWERNQPYCRLEDGQVFRPTQEMLARYKPVAGDYLVTQADGYIYLNPQSVFERKYAPIGEGSQ